MCGASSSLYSLQVKTSYKVEWYIQVFQVQEKLVWQECEQKVIVASLQEDVPCQHLLLVHPSS